jgi:hypothetical protein
MVVKSREATAVKMAPVTMTWRTCNGHIIKTLYSL